MIEAMPKASCKVTRRHLHCHMMVLLVLILLVTVESWIPSHGKKCHGHGLMITWAKRIPDNPPASGPFKTGRHTYANWKQQSQQIQSDSDIDSYYNLGQVGDNDDMDKDFDDNFEEMDTDVMDDNDDDDDDNDNDMRQDSSNPFINWMRKLYDGIFFYGLETPIPKSYRTKEGRARWRAKMQSKRQQISRKSKQQKQQQQQQQQQYQKRYNYDNDEDGRFEGFEEEEEEEIVEEEEEYYDTNDGLRSSSRPRKSVFFTPSEIKGRELLNEVAGLKLSENEEEESVFEAETPPVMMRRPRFDEQNNRKGRGRRQGKNYDGLTSSSSSTVTTTKNDNFEKIPPRESLERQLAEIDDVLNVLSEELRVLDVSIAAATGSDTGEGGDVKEVARLQEAKRKLLEEVEDIQVKYVTIRAQLDECK